MTILIKIEIVMMSHIINIIFTAMQVYTYTHTVFFNII